MLPGAYVANGSVTYLTSPLNIFKKWHDFYIDLPSFVMTMLLCRLYLHSGDVIIILVSTFRKFLLDTSHEYSIERDGFDWQPRLYWRKCVCVSRDASCLGLT
jgi:hypothetical protein